MHQDLPIVKRSTPCGFCNHIEALQLAKMDYWDLAQVELVKCQNCGLTQVDPMLSDEVMDTGCTAFYRMQHHGDNPQSIANGFLRAFRNGVAFATKLKLSGIKPKNILEVGAGDGYFSRGVQYVFPEASITCLDLVDDVLKNITKQHGFKTIKGSPESVSLNEKFDFIIARDVIEHLSQPAKALENFYKLLSPEGFLHFITPNGVEDYWGHFCHWKIKQTPSQILLNHVNYFNPSALKSKLQALGFSLKFWFAYDFEGVRQGYGRKISNRYFGEKIEKKSAQGILNSNRPLEESFKEVSSHKVLNKWWLKKLPKFLVMFFCYSKHYPLFTLDADKEMGHEIFCIAKKSAGATI